MTSPSAAQEPHSLADRVAALDYVRKWLLLGAMIGVVAGLGAVVFINALQLATHFLLGTIGGFTPPSPLNEGNSLGSQHFARPWAIPLVAAFGGLVSGLLVTRFAPEAAGHGTDAAIAAVQRNPSQVRIRTSIIKIIASAFTIGAGGSGGREGPTAQISSGFASFLSRRLRLSPEDARVAVTVGIGSGIGAIFRTPLGGAVLGAEILYREDIESEALIPGLIASIVGFVVYGSVEGYAPIFGYHSGFTFSHPVQLVYYILIGLVAGPVGILYAKTFYAVHGFVHRLPIHKAIPPAVGGLLVGLLALVIPEVLGTGYGWVQEMLSSRIFTFPLWLIILLPFARIVATSLSIGSGGSGGIFGPGMVIGAFVGGAIWRLFESFAPGIPASPAPFVIVGMMACFGSIGHIPFATMLMVAEMTGNLALLAPAMVAVGIATLIVGDRHIYEAQLKTRAHAPAHRYRFGISPVGSLPVSEAMRSPRLLLHGEDKIGPTLARLKELDLPSAAVVDDNGVFLGAVRLQTLESRQDTESPIGPLLEDTPVHSSNSTLDSAMERFAATQTTWMPVIDENGRLAGVITAKELLRYYRSRLRSSLRRLDALREATLVLEERIGSDSPLLGKRIADIAWPAETMVVSIRRGEQEVLAMPSSMLRNRDNITILTRHRYTEELSALLGHQVGAPHSEHDTTPLI
jgi:CIC family chloride channel protein